MTIKTLRPLLLLLIVLAAACATTGCIENNIPYPRIQPNFTAFIVDGASEPAAIDTLARTVTIFLDEDADPANVTVSDFALSPAGAQWPDSALWSEGIDLTHPRNTTLRLYQDYVWNITVRQEISRYFTVDQQVGEALIDAAGHRVIVHVSATAPIKRLRVTSIKLGPAGSTLTPDIEGREVDFTFPVEVTVTSHGRETVWTIVAIPVESTVQTLRVDPWSCVAWLYGSTEAGKSAGFEYRRKSDSEWHRLPADAVTLDPTGSFSGRLTGLTPQTPYVARAFSGKDYGQEIEFTTERVEQMPNSSFDNWWLDGKVWCPWAENGSPYWGSGNKGAATMGQSNTYPSDDTPTGRGLSACLETRFIGLGVVGKLAAGNIFTGDYLRTDGTNGVLAFGRPFTLRPTRLRGWMKYHSAPISHTSAGFGDMMGKPDTGQVWIALIDTPSQFEVRTNPKNPSLFDPKADYVIAYGRAEWSSDVEKWTQFEVTLNYNSTSRRPTYIICTGSASSLGDFFTGGAGSVMYLDDFELLYDY